MTDIEYTPIRGVNIPTTQVKDMEAQYGGILVQDADAALIYSLDIAYKEYYNNRGRYPTLVQLREDPFSVYKPHVIKIQEPITHYDIPVYHKPAWFKIPRIFKGISGVRGGFNGSG